MTTTASTPNKTAARNTEILRQLSLTFVPMTQYELIQYLAVICTQKEASASVVAMVREHMLEGTKAPGTYSLRYILTPERRLEVISELIDLSDREKEALLMRASLQTRHCTCRPVPYDYAYDREAAAVLRGELSRCLLYPQREPLQAAARPGEDYAVCDPAMTQTIGAIIGSETLSQRYAALVNALPSEVLDAFAGDVDSDLAQGKRSWDYDRLRHIVDSHASLMPGERSYFCELLSWPTRLYRDDFEDLGFDSGSVSTWYGYVTLGVRAMERGDGPAAEKLFRSAVRFHGGQPFGNALIDLMLICALKMSSSAMARKTLDSYVRKDTFRRQRGYMAVTLLLQSFSQDVDDKAWDEIEEYSSLYGYSDRAATWMIARRMGAPVGRIPELARFGGSLEGSRDAAIFSRGDLIPYVRQERWEKAYDNVMAKLGYSRDDVKAPAGKAEHSKIIYLLGPGGDFIQPVLKKSKDGVSWSKGRNIALKTFAEGIPEMGELDRSVASHVRSTANYWGGGRTYELGGPMVMSLLAGCGEVYRLDNPDIRVNIVAEAPYLLVEKKGSGVRFGSNVSVDTLSSNVQVIRETDMLYRVITVSTRQKEIIRNLSGVTFPSEARDRLKDMLGFLGRDIVIHSDADEVQTDCETVPASSALTVVLQPEDDGLKADLYVKPFVDVPPYLTPGEGARSVMASVDGRTVRANRSFKAEKESLEEFLGTAAEILGQKRADGSYGVQGPERSLALVEVIRAFGDSVRTEWPEGCRYRVSGACDVKDLSIAVKSGVNWFEMNGDLRISEDRLISVANLLSLLGTSHGRFVQIGEGEFLSLSDKLRAQLGLLEAISREGKGGKLGLPSVAVPVIGELKDAGADVSADAATKRFIKAVKASHEVQFGTPSALKAELRPYQEEGFQWLCRLASWGAGACLADDMGLGKTVQTIALLLHRASDGPALVVAPASVAANWTREIVRFAPSLQVLPLNDMDEADRRSAISSASACDVVLTTYGVLITEAESLTSREWSTVVLDEAHMIKNRDTKSSSACMGLKARFRMILTGTPLQNNVGELWNLFQFINPGYLGTFEHFSSRFLLPIQERGDKECRERLKRMVLPFMLRRTKSDVLEDLPPKTEQYIHVEMEESQTAVYESIRRQAEASAEEHQLNLVETLAQITRLRMAACSPALVDGALPRQSAKTDELVRLVKDLVGGGHKALVFSQFTSFLSIVCEVLDAEGIKYLYLDGGTPLSKRQKLVREFQTGDVPLFVISLKAGGLGLNLTAADYIIHTDPWWNPAIEDQASDRAYRIGQSRPVTVYHLLSRGSIEEKILSLHRDKRSLADALLEGSDLSNRLTREQILALL